MIENTNLNSITNTTTNSFDTKSNLNDSTINFSDAPETESQSWNLSTELCIYINAALVVGIFILGNIRSLGFFEVCMRASQNIYNSMFNGVISTKMRFYDINPSGRILNRFSKDIG